MNDIKIHFLGFGTKTLSAGSTMSDAIWHLGAKYGALDYNQGIRTGAIVVIREDNIIKVNVDMMNEIMEARETLTLG